MRRRPKKNDPWADVRREARRSIRRRSSSQVLGTVLLVLGILVIGGISAGATPQTILDRFSSRHDAVPADELSSPTPSATAQPSATPRPTGSASPSPAQTLLGLASVRAGDCLRWDVAAVDTSIHRVSCRVAHRAEATALVDVSARFTTWPGQSALDRAVGQLCPVALHRYAPARPVDPIVAAAGIVPLADAWATGTHRLVCTAESRSGALIRGSITSSSPVVLIR
jgi:hypothetical protein